MAAATFSSYLDYAETDLIRAVILKDPSRVQELVDKINEKDSNGDTALSWACYIDSPDMVELLLKYGADPNIQNNRKNTPLLITSSQSIAKSLMLAGADINHENNEGTRPIHKAAFLSDQATTIRLVLAGAELNIPDHRGYTALHYCSISARYERLKLMLLYGADPFAINAEGQTCFDVAANDAVKQILSYWNGQKIDQALDWRLDSSLATVIGWQKERLY